ncbi:MAG TPA: 3-oxoadipate enol-lactonase [Gammaproteobacteria bacterium]|nr:3-oxoadipate enol-lactonase [Gammaproteobacteria bacterium]
MAKFEFNGVTLNYETYGDAANPALVLSNSLGTNLSMWQSQVEFFKEHFYVICYDSRGHGASSTPAGAYTVEQLGEDVINLLDHLKVEKASFCGISMGGLVGQWLAINKAERLNKVIVCNTAAKIGEEKAWLERAAAVRENGLQKIAETAASRWFTEGFIQANSAVVAALSQGLAAGCQLGYANCCEALAVADLREGISGISIPLLAIAGQQDPVTTVADAQFIVNQVANSQLFEIDASHISNIEQPAAFNQAVLRFINN